MDYTLMHKDISVAELELDEETGAVQKVGALYRAEHLPVGISVKKGVVDRSALHTWWMGRSIPASRSGVRHAMETLNLQNTQMLLTRCFGLSLSDQYWVKPSHSDLQWRQVNFFENPFSEDIGDVLFRKAAKTEGFNFHSPDNTSDGYLKKRWKIMDGKQCLLKAGSNPFQQQTFNEVVATKVAERLGIACVPYTLLWDEGVPYSVCEDFITPDTELVSAWRIMQTQKKDNRTSVYRHYLNCCERLGIPGMVHAVDQMIVLDYLIANEDRHQNNFGAIRNANTLEWIDAAPIYDSGSSLGYDKLPGQIRAGKEVECKPFKKTHEEQLALVTSFEWIDFEKLRGLEEEVRAVFDEAGEYLDEARKDAILDAMQRRLTHLHELAMTQRQVQDDLTSDVREDQAETYRFEMNMDM